MNEQAISKIKHQLHEYGHDCIDDMINNSRIVICCGPNCTVFDMQGNVVDGFDIDYTSQDDFRNVFWGIESK